MSLTARKTAVIAPPLSPAKPQVTMAPLIDVVFLLLIFFVVATVFPDEQGLTIEVPETSEAAKLPDKQLSFSLGQDGRIYYEGREVSRDEVQHIVAEKRNSAATLTVWLKADKGSRSGDLVGLLEACHGGGAEHVSIVTRNHAKRRD